MITQMNFNITADSLVVFSCSIYSRFRQHQKKCQKWDLNEVNRKKSPLSTLFWYVRLTHQLFPSARHSRQYNEPLARLGSLKNHQQSNGPPGTARGSLIWTPVPTQWVVSLPLSLSGRVKYVQHGRWVMPTGASVTCNHACANAPGLHCIRFYTRSESTFSVNNMLTTQHVARWESKFIASKRSSSDAGKSSAESTRVLLSVSDTGNKKGSEGLFLMTLCKCSLQPSCHSKSAKWITLKAREKCLMLFAYATAVLQSPSVCQ